MKANRSLVLGWIGLSEGGYVNNPKDPGGATDRGITQRTFDAWSAMRGQPLRPVKGISKAEADAIIASQYLDPVAFDALPSGLDYAVADYAVNSGPGRAARDLQSLVGVDADGSIGAKTLTAIHARSTEDLIEAYCDTRLAFLKRAKHPQTGALLWATFGTGWTRRIEGNTAGVQAGDIGVRDRAVMLARGEATASKPECHSCAKAPETERKPIPAIGVIVAIIVAVAAAILIIGG